MFERVDHIGIAVRNLEQALETMRKACEPRLGKIEVVPRFKVRAIMIAAGDAPIELVEPTDADSGVAKFLETRGEGVHHIAYRVKDIGAALAQCRAAGLRAIDETPREGYAESRVAFLHPKGLLGVLTELVERRPGHDVPPYDPA